MPQVHHFLLLQEGVPGSAMQFYEAQGLLRGNLSKLETIVSLCDPPPPNQSRRAVALVLSALSDRRTARAGTTV